MMEVENQNRHDNWYGTHNHDAREVDTWPATNNAHWLVFFLVNKNYYRLFSWYNMLFPS